MRKGLVLVAMMAAAGVAMAQAKELHIAAAADLTPVMPKLAAAYEQEKGVKLIAAFGSSATLTQQLENGDPQDVFLSADYVHPEQLVAAGLALEKAPVPYARGILVLWARKDSPAQPISLDSLTRPGVNRIAVANDLHAPYGLAATQTIKALGLTQKLAGKLVVAENIAQTAQFVESGNAQVGFISLTTASTPHFQELGSFVRIPMSAYEPLQQTGVVLKASKNQQAAVEFLNWLTSAAVQARLKTMGLEPAQ